MVFCTLQSAIRELDGNHSLLESGWSALRFPTLRLYDGVYPICPIRCGRFREFSRATCDFRTSASRLASEMNLLHKLCVCVTYILKSEDKLSNTNKPGAVPDEGIIVLAP